jgi:hypothetical protein
MEEKQSEFVLIYMTTGRMPSVERGIGFCLKLACIFSSHEIGEFGR